MKKHDRYCFCTDCCESREDSPEDFPDYDEWRKAFPELPWDETTKDVLIEDPQAGKDPMSPSKNIRLTSKEAARSDAGLAIISRPQAGGGFKVMAVRVNGLEGTPLQGNAYSATVEGKGDVGPACKEVARWISKMGYPCPMADAARIR